MGKLQMIKGLVTKGRQAAVEHRDKVESAIDKAGDVVDKQTKGKYSAHVNKVQDAAKKGLDKA
ncbi:antitoxin [Aldersonia kunmingensis]|uniref:antitoxin n=1 Tax=Aldersonia kunmingensis TaxID=408066 RepID=UPI00082A9980|nr:antitoxin [Aldersonia kunmingensis]